MSLPVRGQEGTFQYTREGVEITDATDNDNVHSMRTDVTTGFDLKAVEELSKNRRPMNYQVPDYKVDKCTILRAAFYNDDGERSEIQTGAWFIGFEVTIVRLNEVKVNKDFEPEYSVEPVTSRKVLEGVFQIFQERMSSDTE